MRALHPLRRLSALVVIVTSCTLLPACVQPRVEQPVTHDTAARETGADEAVSAKRVADLAQQLESLSRYAAQMEELYAAQEAEILALRQQLASLASRNRASK